MDGDDGDTDLLAQSIEDAARVLEGLSGPAAHYDYNADHIIQVGSRLFSKRREREMVEKMWDQMWDQMPGVDMDDDDDNDFKIK